MKILSTMRAGSVVRKTLYRPRDPAPNSRRRAISISKEDKQRANLKTSYEKLLMLMCANFSPGDWWVTLTYDDDHLPETREASRPYWRKFMRWMRKYRKRNKEPLLYVYCTQLTTRAGGRRLHHHMVMRADRGVTIRYGKNLTSLEQDENCASVYTGVYPYWKSAEGICMIRGTTPTHIFKLSIDTSVIAEARVTYEQFGRAVIEKTERDVLMDGSTITLSLAQEETMRLSHRSGVRLQLKVLTTTGQVLASKIQDLSVGEILNTEVLA